MPLKFCPETALDYARAMARPRLAGTDEEKAVGDELARRLEGFGYRVEKEPFRFWTAVIIAINIQIMGGMILVGLALMGFVPYYVSALGLIVLLLASNAINNAAESVAILPDTASGSFLTRLARRLGLDHAAYNLVANLPEEADGHPKKRLYLVAHYDTKSQPLPIPVRIILFAVLFSGSAGFIAFGLLASVFSVLGPAAFVFGILLIATGLPLILNGYANKSPGAIDNASGVGVVLHLAELLAREPGLRPRLDWTILLTSAEELTLMGAAAYVIRHLAELRDRAHESAVHILNFDGVGVEGRLYYDARGQMLRGALAPLTEDAAKTLGISVKQTRLVGALLDHIPFARRGFDALSLLAIGRASWTVHTRHDTVDRLHAAGFDQAGKLAAEIIRRLTEA